MASSTLREEANYCWRHIVSIGDERNMSMKQWRKGSEREKSWHSEKTLSQHYSGYHESHNDWTGFEREPQRWKAGDWVPGSLHRPLLFCKHEVHKQYSYTSVSVSRFFRYFSTRHRCVRLHIHIIILPEAAEIIHHVSAWRNLGDTRSAHLGNNCISMITSDFVFLYRAHNALQCSTAVHYCHMNPYNRLKFI